MEDQPAGWPLPAGSTAIAAATNSAACSKQTDRRPRRRHRREPARRQRRRQPTEYRLAIVAYILFFIPLLTDAKNDPFVKFHVKTRVLIIFCLWVILWLSERSIPFHWFFCCSTCSAWPFWCWPLSALSTRANGQTRKNCRWSDNLKTCSNS